MRPTTEELKGSCDPVVQKCFDLLENVVDELPEYRASDGVIFYALDMVSSDLVDGFVEAAVEGGEDFWRDNHTIDRNFILWYTLKILDDHDVDNWREHEEVKRWVSMIEASQQRSGRFMGEAGTAGVLRLLSFASQRDEPVQNAIDFIVTDSKYTRLREDSLTVLSLSELDYYAYADLINDFSEKVAEEIQSRQIPSSKGDDYYPVIHGINDQARAIWALTRVGEHQDVISNWIETVEDEGLVELYESDFNPLSNLKERREELREKFLESGIDDYQELINELSLSQAIREPARSISYLIIALSACGKGPRQPTQQIEWEMQLQSQRAEHSKPEFAATKPTTRLETRDTGIRDRYTELIENASEELRISTLRMDMLHDEVIDQITANPDLEVKVITSKKSGSKNRAKMQQAVMNELVKRTEGNVRHDKLVHSRMIVSDDDAVLISSADITRDQLVDEFNAGIYTCDPEVVKQSIDFFEEIWEQAEPRGTR